jgi:ribosomal-protein-alanine N-acetyltransferase
MPLIETERLLIRQFELSDFSDLHEYLAEPSTYAFEPGKPVTMDEAKELTIQRSKGNDFLAVVLKENRKMIGHLYFKQLDPEERRTWELGYIFNPKYHRKGYASEASSAITNYAFAKYSAHRIMARCNPANTASWKLLERIGYVREGYFKKYGFVHKNDDGDPIWTDVYEYSKIVDDWVTNK